MEENISSDGLSSYEAYHAADGYLIEERNGREKEMQKENNDEETLFSHYYHSSRYGAYFADYTDTVADDTCQGNRQRGNDNGEKSKSRGMDQLHKLKTLITSKDGRNWNEEFQVLLESPHRPTPESQKERKEAITRFSSAFISRALPIVKAIVYERQLPVSQRKIPPIEIGGIVGGEKYILDGFFIKFAADVHGIFGDDELAKKIANHELKGLRSIIECNIPNLHLPLVCLVDFLGYRVVVSSIVPISKDTLIYGSRDACRTRPLAEDEQFNALMESLCSRLNLKRHWIAGRVGNTEKLHFLGPADIEGHLALDGRYYILDVARLFPPEIPDKTVRVSHLHRLLRPELVQSFPQPLSSDAFSSFTVKNAKEDNAEVCEATRYLRDVVIPRVAEALNEIFMEASCPEEKLIPLLHTNGCNARYLGLIRSLVLNENARSAILLECVARTLRKKIFRAWRKIGSLHSENEDDEPTEAVKLQPYLDLVQEYLQDLKDHRFDDDGGETESDGEKEVAENADYSISFWSHPSGLKKELCTRYREALTEDEMKSTFDLREGMDVNVLRRRLMEMLGITRRPALGYGAPTPPGSSEGFVDLSESPSKSIWLSNSGNRKVSGDFGNMSGDYTLSGDYSSSSMIFGDLVYKIEPVVKFCHVEPLSVSVGRGKKTSPEALTEIYANQLQIHESLWGPTSPKVLRALSNLASHYSNCGKYDEALDVYSSMRVILDEASHKSLSESVSAQLPIQSRDAHLDLGDLFMKWGKFGDALKSFSLALQVCQDEDLDPADSHFRLSLVNLAMGTFKVAWDEIQLAQDHYMSNNTTSKRKLILVLLHKSMIKREIGAYPDALTLQETAADLSRQYFGAKHSLGAKCQDTRARILYKTGDYDGAEKLLRDALKIRQECLGKRHIDTCNTLTSLGYTMGAQARYKEALVYYKKSLRYLKACYGTEVHPEIARVQTYLAWVLSRQAIHIKARSLYKSAVEKQRLLLGAQHPALAFTLTEIADLYLLLGEYRRGIEHCVEALAIQRASYGDCHKEIGRTLTVLGTLYFELGQYDKAKTILDEAWQVTTESLGVEHPNLAGPISGLAEISFRQGNWKNAKGKYIVALRILRKAFSGSPVTLPATLLSSDDGSWAQDRKSELHPSVIHVYTKLAYLYGALGRHKKATDIYRHCLSCARNANLSLESAEILNKLGWTYMRLQDYDQALDMFMQSLGAYINLFGTNAFTASFSRQRPPLNSEKASSPVAVSSESASTSVNADAEHSRAFFAHIAEPSSTYEEVCYCALKLQHPAIATVLVNLGELLKRHGEKLGELTGADILRGAEKQQRLIFGDAGHADLAYTMRLLGEIAREHGDLQLSLKTLKKSLKMMRDKMGDGHPRVSGVLQSLAQTNLEMGDYESAQKSAIKVIEILECAMASKVESPDSVRVTSEQIHGASLLSISGFYSSESSLDESGDDATNSVYNRALGRAEELLGEINRLMREKRE